ncbi:MAG: hypothetical protein Q9222_005090 [Ikaeria aurantiellina]
MSGIITAPAFNDLYPATKDNSTMQAFVTAIYEVGCLFGAILILAFGDSIGRRRGMMLGGSTMILGVIIQVTAERNATPLAQFIIGRTITGVGNGINTGPPDLVWRFPIAFQIIFALILVIPMYWLPESPRWLLTRGRDDEGATVIAALRGLELDSKETLLQKQIILDSIAASGYSKNGHTPLKAVFTNGRTQHFRRMMLGVSSQFMQQVGGCNAVIYYFPILFETSIGQTHNMSLLLGGVNMVVYAIFATVSWFIIERVGRRKLFLWGTVGQGMSMVIVFSCLIPGTPAAAKGAAVGLFTYIASFGATWLPLPWLYPAEISPVKTRAKANALSTCSNWLFNFLIVMITPIMIDHIGWGTYLFFAIVNACFLPIIYIFYPETKMRSLEEIDIIFAAAYVRGQGKGWRERQREYVRGAREMGYLSDWEIEREARVWGLVSDGEGDNILGEGQLVGGKRDVEEKEVKGM